LDLLFDEAAHRGLSSVAIRAAELHRKAGGYPGPRHRMPTCCRVMKRRMRPGDTVLIAPPSGIGASLTILYKIPRSPTD
jgi:5-methylcytosine-specific restriction protein A